MSKKQQHHRSKQHASESGRHRGERRAHDAAARQHEQDVYTKREAPWVRYTLYGVIAIVVASLTLLFVGGLIRW